MNSTAKIRRTRRKARADGSAARSCFALAALVIAIVLAAASSAYAQGGTTRYVYDDNGRLRAVIAPSGEANIYEYDAAGNFTAIRRNMANTLEALDFYPREGAPGTQVTIIGTGFGAGVNAVAFNGTAAQIVSANAPVVVVTVPSGATTGPISVTTPGGTATTALPFTVGGINVTPLAVTVQSEQTIQFTATVVLSGDQSVVWSVDGIEGGSSTVGTITAAGLYTAPRLLPSQPSVVFLIRATSVVAPSVVGVARVTVQNPEFLQFAYTAAVSVRRQTIEPSPAIAAGISVRFATIESSMPVSAGISVRFATIESSMPVSAGISVRRATTEQSSPIAGGISVRFAVNEQATPFAAAVVVTKGPTISAISPNNIARGANVTVTITGANLTGATATTFVDTNGTQDLTIVASNLLVNANGTSLTATIAVNSSAALGKRLVIITTANGHTLTVDGGFNTIEIVL